MPVLWLAADHAYYLLPVGDGRAWCEHVLTQCAALCGLYVLRGAATHWTWALAVWLAIINRGQAAVCGAAAWAGLSDRDSGADLCVAWLGHDFYTALAALSGAALIVILGRAWQSR